MKSERVSAGVWSCQLRRLSVEGVPVALHGPHESWGSGVVINRVANLGHQHGEVGLGHECVRPQKSVEFRLGQRARPCPQERREQIERLPREVHLAVALQELPGAFVNREVAESKPHGPLVESEADASRELRHARTARPEHLAGETRGLTEGVWLGQVAAVPGAVPGVEEIEDFSEELDARLARREDKHAGDAHVQREEIVVEGIADGERDRRRRMPLIVRFHQALQISLAQLATELIHRRAGQQIALRSVSVEILAADEG